MNDEVRDVTVERHDGVEALLLGVNSWGLIKSELNCNGLGFFDTADTHHHKDSIQEHREIMLLSAELF